MITFVFLLLFPVFRTLPAKHVDKIAEQIRKHNINALLVIGGFEVCLNSFVFLTSYNFADEAGFFY